MDNKYVEKIQSSYDRSVSNTKRIDTLEQKYDNICDLAISIKEIATEMKAMRTDLNEIEKRVVSIEATPIKKINLIWSYIVSGIIGSIITFFAIKLGLR